MIRKRLPQPRLALQFLLLAALACARSDEPIVILGVELGGRPGESGAKAPTEIGVSGLPEVVEVPYSTPTPDPVRAGPERQDIPEWYTVRPGDSLNAIAGRMGIGMSQLMIANGLANPDLLAAGQILWLPTPIPQPPGPSFKIIPDSELVNGPTGAAFDTFPLIAVWDGALHRYRETMNGSEQSGAQIVQWVAEKYSVSPRLLVALLEYQGGWLTRPEPAPERMTYPLGFVRPGFEGLYYQLAWAADQLNQGYYLWRAGWAGPYILSDGTAIDPGPGINAGTAAVQGLLAQLYPGDLWRGVSDENGFYRVYEILFGVPFGNATDPLLPDGLQQPELQLPFEPGRTWSFTGGPHSGWGNWAAWSALDFAPPGDALGCVPSNEWVVAVGDGLILRSEGGEVVQDLDGDGLEGTGWVIQYLHVETRDRVPQGSVLTAGDRIGHPSCEGGVSSGTHLHLSRKYNGEWIPADGNLPFILDGWVSAGSNSPYDGTLSRDGINLEACSCRFPINQISR
jgi:LysM repeat protein